MHVARGIACLIRSENNARFHLPAGILVVLLSACLDLSANEWLWILLSIALVWVAEGMNTAVEKLVDLMSPEYHAQAGRVKDLQCALS